MTRSLLFTACLIFSTWLQAADTVYKISVELPADEVYDRVYKGLEDARFYVVFEPDIGRNLASFEKRWGEDYNRNGLTTLRAMVFCNAWYANQVSNRDPDMLGLCPLHATVVGRDGSTSVLFNRPTVIAAQSPALGLLKEVEEAVIEAIESGLRGR